MQNSDVKKVITADDFTQIKNDLYGNPIYVIHYLKLRKFDNETYESVVRRANKLAGQRYYNKQYGGGIVFQSYYSLSDLAEQLTKHIKG